MRKLFSSFAATLIGFSLLATPAALAKSPQAEPSLVSLGDSITFGYNLGINNDHPSKEAFPYLIGKAENMRVRDLGIPGWTSAQLLNALNTDEKFQEAVRHADVVTIDIGNNDLLQAINHANPMDTSNFGPAITTMLSNLNQIITYVQMHSHAKVVVYDIYNAFQVNDPYGLHDVSNATLPYINTQIAAIAATHGVPVADAYSAFGEKQAELVRLGDVHPTVEGQEVLAQIGELLLNN